MPRFAAERTLLAPLEDVWAFLVEPYHLPDWFPGVSGVQPDRRGVAPGARWVVLGPDSPTFLRRPDASGHLLVLDVVPMQRLSFQLTGQRLDAELDLEPVDAATTKAQLTVEAPFLMVNRAFARNALGRLYDLVQTSVGE